MAKQSEKSLAAANPQGWLKMARHVNGQPGGFLVGTKGTYRFAVEAVATILRPRFESGELRGWHSGDAEGKNEHIRPPLWRIEDACRDLFITSETAAFVALTWASPAGKRAGEWYDVMGRDCRLPACALDTTAAEAMAHDVLAFAKRKGWLRSTRRAA